MRPTRFVAAMLLLSVLPACSDPTRPSARSHLGLDPSLNVTPTSSLDASITDLVARLFPKGLETAAGTRWETIKSKYAAGQTDPAQLAEAKSKLFELVRWIEAKTGQMDDPLTGETRTTAATRLVSYMVMYVFQGPTTTVPAYNLGADATFEVVDPAQDDTVTTPALYAGVNFDAGTFPVPVVVTVIENPTPYPQNCTGPLTTRLCQYARFYEFHVYPTLTFQKPVHIAVCHLDEATPRGPLDLAGGSLHDRLRLAHTLPANPADWTPGATQRSGAGENIEVLPPSAPADIGSSGVDCDAAPVFARAGGLGGLMGRFASTVGRMLTPASLYAVDFGPEHDAEFMSPFNLVDPVGQPDVTVGAMTVSPTPVLAGGSVTTGFTAYNTSPVFGGAATATSDAGTVAIYLSNDATITASDVLLGTVALPALVPDASHPVTGAPVTIPGATAPGAYYVGVIASQPVAEGNASNNTAAVPLTVQSPAPLSAAALGTTLNAGSGTPTIDGQIGTGEWSASECGSIPVNTPQGGTTTGVVCAKNDATNVYFVYQLVRSVDDPGKSISAEFDTNDDGAISAWDDVFVQNPVLSGLSDGVRVTCGTTLCAPADTDESGVNNGSAAYGFHGSYAVYEVSKPLASGDGRDVSLMPGDAIDWFFEARLINGPTFPGDYGDTRYPATGLMTLQLSGATSVPNPSIVYTGSEQYATGPTNLFDRYSFDVTNRTAIPEALFDPMPGLPACGTNTNASRTWVDILNASGGVMYGFCGLGSASDLAALWVAFTRWTLPTNGASIRLTDRLRGTTYTSTAVPLYGPVFTHFPRALELNWAPMAGAVTYDTYWEYGNGCTTGDWTTCSTTWSPGGTSTGLTGDSHTISFVGAQQGRWRVTGRDATGAPVGTTAFKYFRFTI